MLLSVTVADESMVDAMGRLALARIIGCTMEIALGCSMPDPVEILITP